MHNTNASSVWGGRFSSGPAGAAALYGNSQRFDRELWRFDIEGSLAHARMLGIQKILSEAEVAAIVAGLERIREEIASGTFLWKEELEDVHMNIEGRLIEIAGDAGKKLHTGRSRNDQVALAFRLYIADACTLWAGLCREVCRVLINKAGQHQKTILPGCTHMQPAQPVSLAHHLLAYAFMFKRDVERIDDALKRIRISPLGAAALAGTTYPIDPGRSAAAVGFDAAFSNSMDAVSDRDFVLEALFAGSCIAMHLSRLCEELIIWANPAFGFINLPDAFSTGSSIMPQKKNPDIAELMRGKTGRVYGNLIAMLTVLKGLPLAYNKDLQEDKECFFDTNKTVSDSLALLAEMLEEISFNKDRMEEACKRGFINATELADYLNNRGIPFREAHHITGQAVARAEELGVGLENLPLSEYKSLCESIDDDIYPLLSYSACVARRISPGGTGPESVQAQLSVLEQWLRSRE